MKILFMGTPEFAAVSLEGLAAAGEDIIGVVTQPDRPAGRRQPLAPPAVKVKALSHGLEVYQPESVRAPEFMKLLERLDPELIIVVAYGKILPKEILGYPKYGCVNVHASLLPRHRGANPIAAAIMAGDAVTGVTTIYMDEGIDTGDMIISKQTSISENDDLESLHDRLAVLGAQALVETVKLIANGKAPRTPQNHTAATYAPKMDNASCALDFNSGARELWYKVRGLHPIPGACAMLDGRRVKILQAHPLDDMAGNGQPGEVIAVGESIIVKTGQGCLGVAGLQREGERVMTAEEFTNGRKISAGMKFN